MVSLKKFYAQYKGTEFESKAMKALQKFTRAHIVNENTLLHMIIYKLYAIKWVQCINADKALRYDTKLILNYIRRIIKWSADERESNTWFNYG